MPRKEPCRPPAEGWPLFVSIRGRHDRGCRTRRAVDPGTTLVVSPLVLIHADDLPTLEEAGLEGWVFDLDDGTVGLALGEASFCNHSWTPNAEYETDAEARTITITARRRIPSGAEVTINYNGEVDDRSPLWFDPL